MKIDYRGTELPAHEYEKFVVQSTAPCVPFLNTKCAVIRCSNTRTKGKEGFCAEHWKKLDI